MDGKIQIRDTFKKVILEVTVDVDDFEYLNQYKWYLNRKNGYVYTTINCSNVSLHRLVMRNTDVPKNHVIDHVNNVKSDNRKNNLRIVSYSANAHNIKSHKTHIGVFKRGDSFYGQVTYQGKKYNIGTFNSIEEASNERDKAVYLLYKEAAKLNGILTDQDKHTLCEKYSCFEEFMRSKTRTKNNNLPKGVYKRYNKYSVIYKKQTYSGFNTVEEASKHYNYLLNDEKEIQRNDILQKNIERNEVGQAVIPLNKSNSEICQYAIVDDFDWYNLIQYSWSLTTNKYVAAKVGTRIVYMHRYLYNEAIPDGHVVDHINQNRIDNRRTNLRVVSYSENNQNISRPNKGNKTSKYIGVTYAKDKGKWFARIHKDNKKYHLGHFEHEEAAAKAYDIKAKELYAKPLLNFQ